MDTDETLIALVLEPHLAEFRRHVRKAKAGGATDAQIDLMLEMVAASFRACMNEDDVAAVLAHYRRAVDTERQIPRSRLH